MIKAPDWPGCIRQLEQRGMTQRQIAKKLGTCPATVNHIKNRPGHEPLWSTGQAVLLCLGELDTV